ncbi:MAG: hypothetical protein P1V34_14895 [Alphaproteobacteria bacterium]|nr:hypothetical protein [Alphaproteobacteria bacterium]
MGTTESTATNLLPKGTATSAGSPPSGPGSNGPDYGDSSGSSYTSPSYTPPDAAIRHMPFLNPNRSEPAFPSTPTPSPYQDPEIYTPWRAPENSAKPLGKAEIGTHPALPLVETDPDPVAQTSRDQIQTWKSRVEAQTQQQAKAAAPTPKPKPMSVTPKRPSPLSAEARASNGRLAEAMARASDPTQILPILKDAQDIDPAQFKAEFQDISDQLWQNLPAHRRETAHQDFMTQAKHALGWDQAPTPSTAPTQNPHPDVKDPNQRSGQVTQQSASAEAQPTATPLAQQATPGPPQGGASQDQTTDPSQPPTSNPESAPVPKSYEVQRNPHTGEAYLYDAKTRDLVRTADGTPATIGDVAMPVIENDVKATQQRDQVMTDVLARIRENKILEPGEAQELLQKVAETYPYAPDIQENIDYMLKAHQTSISKDNKDFSVDNFERLHQQLKDPSFQAKYEQNIQHLNRIKTGYQGGVPKYQSDRGAAIERQNDAARKVISAYAKVQSFNSGSQGPINLQSETQDKRLLQEASAEFKAAMSETSKYMDLPYPDSSLGMDKKFKAAETAGQDRRDLLIGTALFLAGGLAGSGAKAVAMMAFKRLGKSAASMELAGTAAKLLASNGVRAADVYNAYQTGVREAIDTVLKDATTAQGKPIDWSDPVARHDALSNNPDLQKTITEAGERYAFATFIGSKAGGIVGTVADVAAPGMNPIMRAAGENPIGGSVEWGTKNLLKRSSD